MSNLYKSAIPVDVPRKQQTVFWTNYQTITRGTDRLLMFACDQKIEHLNSAFYGEGISLEDNDPEHLFRIASQGYVGAFATHLGLIARYGFDYPKIPYLVKINGKTNLIPTAQRDPISEQLWSIGDVITFKQESGINICGIGYTVYLGSEFEHIMLAQAAQAIFKAHQNGLIAILWIYPRGKAVINDRDAHIIAGAAGVGASLGADFVKINVPLVSNNEIMNALSIACQAAGRTKVIVAGGALDESTHLVQSIYAQLQRGGIAGCALGRNIHQRSLDQAVTLTQALSELIYKNVSLEKVLNIIKN